MSVQTRVKEWLAQMGYDGEVPAALSKICTPSTAFIWEQLITNVKSRQEVEHKRKTIIVNRLSQTPLERQDEFGYPIKEIRVYVEKQKREKRVKYLEREIQEKEEVLDRALEKNKVTCVAIDSIKARIKEMKQKKFLLDKKSKTVEEDIQKAGEVLTLAKNLTPVEMEASPNTDEITQTLQKCAEKLQKLSDGIAMPRAKKNSMSASGMSVTKTPKYFRKNTFSQYLEQSTTLADIAPSCRKSRIDNKENFDSNHRGTNVHRCLKFSNNDPKTIAGSEPKRDSLGLLSDDCLNTSEEVDAFLLSPLDSFLQPLSDSVFEEPTIRNYEILEKLRSDNVVKETLRNLLHKNNRYLIVTQCRNIFDKLLKELRTPILECNKLSSLDRNIGQDDLTELYFVHVKTELEKEKCRILLKILHESVKKRREDVLNSICSRSRKREELTHAFELQIEEAFLTGANNFLRKEINSSKNVESGNELQVVNLKIKQLKEELVGVSGCIQALILNSGKVVEDIKRNREETYMYVKKLNPYIADDSWANVLTRKDHSEEIDLFKKFPLEYNRKFKYNNVEISHENISDTTVPPYIKLSSNDLENLTRLINVPFATSEHAIFDFLQARISSNMLKSAQPQMEIVDLNYNNYTLEELRKREDFVEPTIGKLKSIVNSGEVKQVLGGPNYMKQVTALRVEMPFRNFVSEKRQVDGHGYKFYENALKKLRNE